MDDEAEQMRLLSTAVTITKKVTEEQNFLDGSEETVECSKCGYVNKNTSSICRNCNALLHETSLFKLK